MSSEQADFEAWVRARSASLARTAYLLTGDVHLAEDLVQDALARVAQHWRRVRSEGEPDAYVRVVLHRLAVDRWRRRSARPAEVLSGTHLELGSEPADVERRLVLRDALARLTAKQRAVLSLRFYEDLTEVRTAEVLGCTVSTVKSQTRRALQRIRDLAPDLLDALAEESR